MDRISLRGYDGEDKIISNIEQIDHIERTDPITKPYLCGLPSIDEALDGFVDGEFIILSGKPKHGKSLTMRTFINNFYQAGHLSMVFSYEEQPRYFYRNFPDYGKELLFYVPRRLRANDIDWICERSIEAKLKVGAKFIFIDHGHYLFRLAESKNSSGLAGDIARKLKRLAVDENLVVFLIWHIMKAQLTSPQELDQSLIRDSGLICGEMDTLLFTYRKVTSNLLESKSEGFITIDVARRSGAMKLMFPVIKEGHFFKEIDRSIINLSGD